MWKNILNANVIFFFCPLKLVMQVLKMEDIMSRFTVAYDSPIAHHVMLISSVYYIKYGCVVNS